MTAPSCAPATAASTELVVLLTEDGVPCGTAPKAQVHHSATPLHLAFSCWVLDDSGRTLLTRRAEVKRTWPGVWTNSFCGHPGPGEEPVAAVHRRAADELGTLVTAVAPVLPRFRYRAEMADGTVENEVCPVFTASLAADLAPDPAEVGDWRWVHLDDLRAEVEQDASPFSPWMLLQLAELPVAAR
ncbi:isopentenyl-diphosphate Delta-isomerase [Kineococcus sp. SYSU DK018]|uniref:isopentenyl-diphosphate Delta-isomerase n=1 Tax=Kineococcus sp. SYSU DK018 TaxID=3383139 RepID=UPI003D7EDA44